MNSLKENCSCLAPLDFHIKSSFRTFKLLLVNYLRDNPIGIVVPGAGAIFSDYDAVIPDLAFVSNERWSQIVSNDRFNCRA